MELSLVRLGEPGLESRQETVPSRGFGGRNDNRGLIAGSIWSGHWWWDQ